MEADKRIMLQKPLGFLDQWAVSKGDNLPVVAKRNVHRSCVLSIYLCCFMVVSTCANLKGPLPRKLI